MLRESLLRFFGTGMVVLPTILAIGTGSLDVVAISMFVLLLLQLGVLVVNGDDPIGDKMRAEEAAREREKLPPE
jgi:hypothetical protein